MDTRKLEYLEAVYRLRNFTKAANEQFVSQSSLSEAILRLEEEMGAKLINRDVKPIEFTPSGEVFMKYVYPLLNIVRTAREEVALSVNNTKAEVHFSWAGKYKDMILYQLLENFAAEYPQYILLPHEGTSALMLEQILKDEIEFAYMLFPEKIDFALFHIMPLQCSILSAAVSRENPLSKQDTITLEQLEKEKVFIPPEGARLRSALDTLFFRNGLAIHGFQVIPPFQMQRLLAKQNKGIYLTTKDDMGESNDDPDFAILPIENSIVFSKGIVTKMGGRLSSGAQTAVMKVSEIIQKLRNE